MDIRRWTLAGSLCVLGACAARGHGVDDPVQPPNVSDGPVPFPPGGGIGGGFGGVGRVPGGHPQRLTELRVAERPPRPISGGTLAVHPDGSYAVAADPDRDMVYVVKTDSLAVTKISLPADSDPGRVVMDAAGRAHVVLRGSGKLVRVDLASGSLGREATLCDQARGLAYDAARNRLVAACMDGHVVMLEAADYAEISRTYVAQDLRDVVVGSSGRTFVSRYRSAELISLDGAGAVLASSRPRQAHAQRLRGPIPPVTPTGLVEPPRGGVELRDVTFSPTLAWRAAPGPNGQVWMLHQESQDDAVAASAGGYGGACAPITKGAVTRFGEDGTPLMMSGVALLGVSVDLAPSPAGDWIALASPGGYLSGAQTLQVYAASALTDDMNQDFCSGPHLIGGDSSQVVAVAFDAAGLLYTLSREPVELEISSLANGVSGGVITRIATITLDRRSMRDTGHELFHADVGSGLSCASCHGEALDDGHVWTFDGIGPRRTQNMRGGLLATAPFHWDGDMTSFRKLVDDVMTGRMGGFPVSDSYAEALARWIDAQPALLLSARDSAAVARGKALFHASATACASCHAGDTFTNNESADVGTGGSFQVPSLRGLGLRAPYMHDGCAKTIEGRFDAACGGGDLHGKTSQLSREELADLSAYLRSL